MFKRNLFYNVIKVFVFGVSKVLPFSLCKHLKEATVAREFSISQIFWRLTQSFFTTLPNTNRSFEQQIHSGPPIKIWERHTPAWAWKPVRSRFLLLSWNTSGRLKWGADLKVLNLLFGYDLENLYLFLISIKYKCLVWWFSTNIFMIRSWMFVLSFHFESVVHIEQIS